MTYIFKPENDKLLAQDAANAILFNHYCDKNDCDFVFDSKTFPKSAETLKWLGILWSEPKPENSYTKWINDEQLNDNREAELLRIKGFLPLAFSIYSEKKSDLDLCSKEAIMNTDEDDLAEYLFHFLKKEIKDNKIDRENLLTILRTEKRNAQTLVQLAERASLHFKKEL